MPPVKPLKALTTVDDENALGVKYVDIETIRFLPSNIKAHDVAGIQALIERFGFVEPIGINRRTGHDIFGNGRLETLLKMLSDGSECPKGIVERIFGKTGLKTASNGRKWYAPVIDNLDFSPEDEIVLAAGMNRVQEKGGIDNAKAYEILSKLRAADPESLTVIGYDDTDLQRIRQLVSFAKKMDSAQEVAGTFENVIDHENPESREDFVAALNQKWQVKLGDIWMIGKHKLVCADITNAFDFFVADKIRLCLTSPPYDNQRNYETGSMPFTQLMIGMCQTVFKMAGKPFDMIVNLGVVYEDARYKEYWHGWQQWMDKVLDQPVYGVYVWDKQFGFPGNHHGRLCRAHEYLFHFSIGHAQANKWIPTTGEAIKRGPKGHQMRKANASLKHFDSPDKIGQDYKVPDSVIRITADMTRGIHTKGHPAVYPVDLAEFIINTWSNVGDIVFEPFCGSGSTMIAAQNLDRVCVATEISPNYCSLILERMTEKFPDIKIERA